MNFVKTPMILILGNFEEKFEINMLAANDINLRILTYLLRSRK